MDSNTTMANTSIETLDELNSRYASALLPLTITFGVFTFLGIGGNLLILLVFSFSREYKRNNFKIFVITLAIIDIITCMTLIPAEMIKQRNYFEFSDATSCKVKCFFNIFGACASCMTLFVISLDRYRQVVQPLHKQMSPKLAICSVVFSAFVLPILFAIPVTIMCGTETSYMTNVYGTKTKIHLCSADDRYKHSIWRKVYKVILIIVLAVMSFAYLLLYIFVMREVLKQLKVLASNKKRHRSSNSSQGFYDKISVDPSSRKSSSSKISTEDESDLGIPMVAVQRKTSTKSKSSKTKASCPSKTILWLTLTVIFVITYLTHSLACLFIVEVPNMSPIQLTLFSVFFRFYFFNNVINPLMYAIFMKRFRQSCRTLWNSLKNRITGSALALY